MSTCIENLPTRKWSQPVLATQFDTFEFGKANLDLEIKGSTLSGTIGGTRWQLSLHGVLQLGSPATLRFQGSSLVTAPPGSMIISPISYCKPPRGLTKSLPSLVVYNPPHTAPDGKRRHNRAGVLANFYAVKQS